MLSLHDVRPLHPSGNGIKLFSHVRMPTIRILNTLSGTKEPLPETGKRPLRLFVCGPTVYDYIHIGNARTNAVFDTFARYVRSRGIKLFYLENITDIDDKIIRRAAEEKSDWKKLARTYEHAFREDMKKLNIRSVTKYARATSFIKEIVQQVQTLAQKGHTYEIPDGWYFDLTTFPNYGKLAKRTVEEAEDGISRIDENPEKRNRGDFCLWKLTNVKTKNAHDAKKKFAVIDGVPAWNTPLGWGRPGWHIEDTAITESQFGPQYELHGGGVDLIFPHHEAEIAQQESASGKKPFVKLWMHVAFFDLKGAKMSKSAGNIITVRDFLKIHDANVFRMIVAEHHYRTRIEYDETLATQAENALRTFHEFLEKLRFVERLAGQNTHFRTDAACNRSARAFDDAMADDVNTPRALAALFELINEIQPYLWTLSRSGAKTISSFIRERLAIFGIVLLLKTVPPRIQRLATRRESFRVHKQFMHADALRRQIETLGYTVEDTPLGPLVLKKLP